MGPEVTSKVPIPSSKKYSLKLDFHRLTSESSLCHTLHLIGLFHFTGAISPVYFRLPRNDSSEVRLQFEPGGSPFIRSSRISSISFRFPVYKGGVCGEYDL